MSLGQTDCPLILPDVPLQPLEVIEKSIQKKYRELLWSPFIKALKDFDLVNENDKIAVAISGGKDSLLLAKLFQELKRASKTKFELVFIAMNPGFNQRNLDNLKLNLEHLNIPCHIYDDNIFDIAGKIAKDYPCYMCAKMRRGSLYSKATELGCNKLALGHHLDDVVETTLMSMFYMGKFETMLPKLKSDNFDIELIRPLFYIEEKNIIKFVKNNGIQAMNCGCTVAAEKTSSKRRETKEFIKQLSVLNPNIKKKILSSTFNVNIEKILGFKFKKDHFFYLDEYKFK
ncbi:tRNA 2-thiocytidine(32) synthetase TtcA [Streptobacillus moniliformis]|uniref:PP-loop domain protein n=2 Tax=Streptobacillus moniliformis TaxID=34105 RepID=D1AY28_STRM9|nr:tRNA 2-thiocytidine(32) synthetase TtcA [Streptobacillus moniliformis]ACZ01204.1 PP-loop domain protein [Streptobacillus moniliformis DSM 12112]AVL42439.1 tRNA 2-thiocytidine(32) synthetase TtcA [Streptobacillus moniliformis]SQA13644.1 tRNA 2-thiocytidine biosynthesis protein TtcA [Streptobacillus moniliformis]